MEQIDFYSVKAFCLTVFLFIFSDITGSDIALFFTITAGATTLIRNWTGMSLQTLFKKIIYKLKRKP